jgi:hypothetical protein
MSRSPQVDAQVIRLAGAVMIALGVLTILAVMITASVTIMKPEDILFMWGAVGFFTAVAGLFLFIP